MKQTAVEWLESEMLKPNLSMKEILNQAKEIEKQQIIDACNKKNVLALMVMEYTKILRKVKNIIMSHLTNKI